MAEKLMKQKVKAKKTTKKVFFEVPAPLISTKIFLYASTPQELDGKTAKIDLTKSLRGKNLELTIRIKNENEKLNGYPESVKLVSSYVKKVVRKGTDYAEDSFEVDCKDALVRIKPLLLTRRRVSKTVLNTLRENARKNLEAHIKTRDTQELFSEIISNKLQKQLASKLKKIYPLALCEIRMFEIVSALKKAKPSEENSTN